MKDSNHLHKLKRHWYSTGKAIYFCVNDCTFRVSTVLALGKVVECWRCGKPFSMNKYSLTLDKPHCEECHKFKGEISPRKGKKENKIKPLEAVSNAVGDSLVSDLRGRLNQIIDEHAEVMKDSIPVAVFKDTEKAEQTTQTTEIREFKLEDEEEFI